MPLRLPLQDNGLASLLLRRWRIMGVTLVVVLAVGAVTLAVRPKTFEASSRLLIMRTEQRLGGLDLMREAMPTLSMASNPLFTQLELLRSTPVFADVITRLKLKDSKGIPWRPEALAGMVKVAPIVHTDLIEIKATASDPFLAQRIVTTLVQVYLKRTETQRMEGIHDGLKLVDEQLQAAHGRLLDSENKLLAFKHKARTVALGEEIQAVVGEVSSINQDIRARQIDLVRARSRASSLRHQLGMDAKQALRAAALAQNPRIQALQGQLVEAEASPLRTQGLGSNHPELAALEQRIAMLKQAIADDVKAQTGSSGQAPFLDSLRLDLLRQMAAAETEVQGLQSSVTAAEEKRRGMLKDVSSLPGHEIALGRLTREVQVSSEVYQSLLQKREEARLNLAIAPTSARIVEPAAVPNRPNSPLQGPQLPIMLLAGFGAAFCAGATKDLLDRELLPEDLAYAMPELKIFSAIPYLSLAERLDSELLVQSGNAPHYVEAVKTLAMAVDEHLVGEAGRALAITSTAAGEGKSVTIANLSLCLAEAGHRVLLVDADYRRPRIHEIFKLPGLGRGLSELLQGKADVSDVIQSRGQIDIITAGSSPLTGAVAKLRRGLKPLMDEWRKAYDFILIDLPPLALMAEVAHFAKRTDGLLLLANLRKSMPDALTAGVRQLQALRVPLTGLIAISPMVNKRQCAYPYLVIGEGTAS